MAASGSDGALVSLVPIVTIRFGRGVLPQPWHDKMCAKQWLEGNMAEITQLSQPCIQKMHLLHSGYGIIIFLNELDSNLIDYHIIRKLVELAGGGGQVSRLTDEDVGQEIVNHMHYKKHMHDKANSVGYMGKTHHILSKALSMQGERGSPTKNQRQMGQQAVDILKRAQKVASHKLRELHEKTESEDEEDEGAID